MWHRDTVIRKDKVVLVYPSHFKNISGVRISEDIEGVATFSLSLALSLSLSLYLLSLAVVQSLLPSLVLSSLKDFFFGYNGNRA